MTDPELREFVGPGQRAWHRVHLRQTGGSVISLPYKKDEALRDWRAASELDKEWVARLLMAERQRIKDEIQAMGGSWPRSAAYLRTRMDAVTAAAYVLVDMRVEGASNEAS